ncbi:MAG: OmpH family outer membrane protein [Rikenellaceae bacterium]|jgi:outer membrane protein|nr:OmpH family outer membrane protein [Rikenellaceae bacterium]
MKKFIFSALFAVAALAGFAQKQMVINTETVFKALPRYASAINSIDALAKQYQGVVDQNYAAVEKMYNEYQSQKAYMTESARRTREDAIVAREKEIEKYQEEKFGQEGEIIKKRIELIKPIQDSVFAVVAKYAEANGYTVVLDIATNPTVIYYSPDIDKTQEIIKLAK